MTGYFCHLDHANLPVSDRTYIFCKLSQFGQILSEVIDVLGFWSEKVKSWVNIKKRVI